jgi:ubiquinone/menaquinone biosynthesis C-methylase UbiE
MSQDRYMILARLIVIASVALILVAPAGAHDVSEEIDQIAELMELRPGMQLADVGAGDGELAEALARRVGPAGHVFINEIDDGELRKIVRRIEKSDLTNMTRIEGDAKDARLPDASCDGILLRYVYHHISEREAMRSSLRRSLRPQGKLVVIEKLERGGHGISMDDMIDEITADGFRLISRHPGWGGHDGHHAAVFAP